MISSWGYLNGLLVVMRADGDRRRFPNRDKGPPLSRRRGERSARRCFIEPDVTRSLGFGG